jgi:hypothetical protein
VEIIQLVLLMALVVVVALVLLEITVFPQLVVALAV